MTWIWISIVLTLVLGKVAFGGKANPGKVFGVAIYGVGICLYNMFASIFSKIGAKKIIKKIAKPIPQSVLDIVTTYRLAPMEVVLGFDRKRPIKVDFNKNHTLIAGVTGFGKTYMLVSILIQLFSKGTRFTDFCDVYLFDYKADGDDYLFMWKGLVKGYYSISENSAEEAIAEIRKLANGIHDKPDKRILVIIDEVASISASMKTEANDALMLLAGKLRSRGVLVVATQHPRYDIIPRSVTTNMSRKIGVHVDDKEQAKLIFRTSPPQDLLPDQPGEFLLKEPGVAGFTFGIGIEPKLPLDVVAAIKIAAPQDHDDPRVKFLIDTIAGLSEGDSILGINKRVAESKKVGVELKQKVISDYYKLFENANVFSKPKRGETRKLACSPVEAIRLLEEYIDGKDS